MSNTSTPIRFTRLLTAALLLTLTVFQSCKKDDDQGGTTNTPKEEKELIVGTWRYTAVTSDIPYRWADTVNGTDGFTYMKECLGKTTWTFTKGATTGSGPFTYSDACKNSTDNDTWALNGNSLRTSRGTYTVELLDEQQLKMSAKISGNNNQETKITYTLARN